MFHKSAWLLCVFLLCFGQTLCTEPGVSLQKNDRVQQTPELHEQVSEHLEKNNSTPLNSGTKAGINMTTLKPNPQPEPTTSTTTAAPAPTTSSTTSTAAPEKSTSPSTTPAHVPTTPTTSTPVPVTPKPGPQSGNWSVKDDKNITCLIIEGVFSIDYTINKTVYHFDVPKGAKSSGTCNGEKGTIKLIWKNATHNNSLEFIFKHNHTEKNYVLASFEGEVSVPFKNTTRQEHFNTNNNYTHFSTPVNQSYSCSAIKQVIVDDHTKVTLVDFHLQAFKSSNSTGFDASVDCSGSNQHTPDIVPIIVGCVLALLVIAVLVAYLISRRRSQTRGYLSM